MAPHLEACSYIAQYLLDKANGNVQKGESLQPYLYLNTSLPVQHLEPNTTQLEAKPKNV